MQKAGWSDTTVHFNCTAILEGPTLHMWTPQPQNGTFCYSFTFTLLYTVHIWGVGLASRLQYHTTVSLYHLLASIATKPLGHSPQGLAEVRLCQVEGC